MKKQKKYISLFLAITLLFITTHSQPPNYTTPTYGRTKVDRGTFSDIAKNPSRDNILKLQMLSIIQGGANAKYNPNAALTKQEAAAYIIRMLGQEKAAQEKAAAMTKAGTRPNYIADSWAIGYMEELLSQGILTNEELREMETLSKAQLDSIEKQVDAEARKGWMTLAQRDNLRNERQAAARLQNKNMRSYISRQDLALWLSRALGAEETSQDNTNATYVYNDYEEIKPNNLQAVATLLQSKVIEGASKTKYNPTGAIKRSEAADIFNRAIKAYPEALDITTDVARVTNTDNTYELESSGILSSNILTMENFDGTVFSVTTQGNNTLPIIKDGKIYSHDILRKGDTLEYAIKDDEIIYGLLGNHEFIQGTLSYFDGENIIRIEDSQNNIEELDIDSNSIITALNIPIKKRSLIPGQPVKALYKGRNLFQLDIGESVDYYADIEYIDGIIKYMDINGGVIKLEDYDGNMRTYGLDERVEVTINDYYEKLENLNVGQDATFEIANRNIKGIKAFAIPTQETAKEYLDVLRVREVDGNNIKVTSMGERTNAKVFKTDGSTSITYLGYPIKIHNIKVGDLIKLKSNNHDKNKAESIELNSKRQRLDKIYKADILNTLPTERSLALSNVHTYSYPDWLKINNERVLPIKRDAEIYKDGRKLDLKDLDKEKGIEAYIATVNDFGQETIAKITLKSVSEDSVFSGYFSTEWSTDTLRLEDGQILAFNDGTIIIKDRRILDSTDLTYNDEAFIIKNKLPGGSNYAALMSLENVNDFNYRNVVRGYIHDMGEDNFSLESYANLINNQWDYYYDYEEYFYVSKDTKILDNVVKNNYITRDTFLESRYWEKGRTYNRDAYTIHDPSLYEGDKGPHYKKCRYKSQHMLTYAVINEDGEAIGINIYKRDPGLGRENVNFTENLKSGEVEDSNINFTQLTLTDVKEFSYFYDRWQPTGSKDVINLSNAMIIKNDRIITQGDLSIGDKIYAITDENNGIMVFVE